MACGLVSMTPRCPRCELDSFLFTRVGDIARREAVAQVEPRRRRPCPTTDATCRSARRRRMKWVCPPRVGSGTSGLAWRWTHSHQRRLIAGLWTFARDGETLARVILHVAYPHALDCFVFPPLWKGSGMQTRNGSLSGSRLRW